jgi:hypothetical protein
VIGLSTLAHGSARSPSGKLVQKTIPSAPCGPIVDLFTEIRRCSSQPEIGNLNEKRMSATVRVTSS